MSWFYKFIKRQGFSIKNVTHKGQELRKESKEYTTSFFKMIFNIISKFNIIDNIGQFGNMDETAIYYENIYNTSIEKIGEKSVYVRNFGKDKLRISAVLCILADATKLPPLLIFRGKTNRPKENELKKYLCSKRRYIY